MAWSGTTEHSTHHRQLPYLRVATIFLLLVTLLANVLNASPIISPPRPVRVAAELAPASAARGLAAPLDRRTATSLIVVSGARTFHVKYFQKAALAEQIVSTMLVAASNALANFISHIPASAIPELVRLPTGHWQTLAVDGQHALTVVARDRSHGLVAPLLWVDVQRIIEDLLRMMPESDNGRNFGVLQAQIIDLYKQTVVGVLRLV